MIKLSDRLEMLAREAGAELSGGDPCAPVRLCVADIGTDHGFLPIYMYEAGTAGKVILTDVSRGSLEKARQNCLAAHPEMDFDLRLGDGMQVLEPGEADVVVIAGMGGQLMTEIIGQDLAKSMQVKRFVLQPRSACGQLRRWLLEQGFAISRDLLVREGKFICQVIVCQPAGTRSFEPACEMAYELPPWLGDFNDREILEDFIGRNIAAQQAILTGMLKASDIDQTRVAAVCRNIEYMETL